MSHLDLVRSNRSTTAPLVRPRSLSPNIGERLLAFGIDVAAFVVTAPFLLGFCAVVLRDYWAIGAVALVSGYAAGSWALCGRTLGMYLAGIAVVDERTGRRPSIPQAVMRTALTVPALVGATVLLNAMLIPGPDTLADVWLLLAGAATLMGLLSSAWALVDSGRMLHDRLSGILTVRGEAAQEPRGAVRW